MAGNSKIIGLTVTIFIRIVVAQESCNENGFLCTSNTTYKLCIDGDSPSQESTCASGTYCDMACSIECSSNSCVRCNQAGYFCFDDQHFQECMENEVVPTDTVNTCPTGTVCSTNCNSVTMCSTQRCPVTCTESTRLPVPGNSSLYYLCNVDPRGEVRVTTQSCPSGTIFSDVTKRCTHPIPTTTPTTTTTTTPKPFECPSKGRFGDPYNCTIYYLCIPIDGGWGYGKYPYRCPLDSYFDPISSRCTLNPSVCARTASFTKDQPLEDLCVTNNARLEDLTSCSHYLLCHGSEGQLNPHRYACPDGSVFSPHMGKCTHHYDCN